ncbi:MAG: DNA polymerase III subunit alpha, partial [Actinobacteria bacterium]|nr:DNA polymerase III subunit alpha [Actinomycetota bacterium]
MFVHLHVHSHYSLLESSIKIEDLVNAASKLGMHALALTDKYVMSGAVQFYRLAKEKGIRPLTGCEICLVEKNNCSPSPRPARSAVFSHLTLLVKNKKGYENLCSLVSKSHIDSAAISSPDKTDIPAVGMEDLEKFSQGIVCLSGCSKGKIAGLLRNNDEDNATHFAKKMLNIFGGDFYIEIQRCGPSCGASELLAAFSTRYNIAPAATNNVHYLSCSDYSIYRYLSNIKSMSLHKDPAAGMMQSGQNYLKSKTEMAALFKDMPAAIKNTEIIAEKCTFDFELGKTLLPVFKTPEGREQHDYLAELCRRGLYFRFGKNPSGKVTERLSGELEVIRKTGFSGYFLIVADIAEFAHRKNIPLCGKGSSAGSLVSYLLRISNVDPVENNLYFERFLNEERKEPPDIDIDISSKDREKIWDYLRSKYGNNSVARVSSFATNKPRASIRESGRILGMAKEDIDYVVKAAPAYNRFYTTDKMEKTLESGRIIDIRDPFYKKVMSVARQIGGYIRHVSMHPSAFIVSNQDLSYMLPLTLSETGHPMSQYDINSIDDMGILKIDLISSLSLSLIADVGEMLHRQRGIKADTANMSYNDKKVFALMQEGKTLGVFQLESFGIRALARKIKPACINDITLLVSLYRPGPQQSGMVNNFIERKFGREKISYIHADLEPLLKETFGVILYQEQAMQVAIKIAGYSLSEADSLRKAMANLSREEMLLQRRRFTEGGIKKGYDIKTVNEVFELISKFASYGFVKAHAAAYAEISYETCFLKYYYPAEFISAILTNNSGYYSKMQYLEEARRMGIKLKLPDINKSGFEFTVEERGKAIRVPLISVAGLGCSAVASIINERGKNGDFFDFTDFFYRAMPACRITRVAVENLIKVGAFDFCGITAKKLLLDFYCMKKIKKSCHAGQAAFTYRQAKDCSSCSNTESADDEDFSIEEKLLIEAEVLGFYISSHPLQFLSKRLLMYKKTITQSSSFYRIANGCCVFAAGIIISKRIEKTKNNKNMMFCTMEDQDGMYEAVFFPDKYDKYIKMISCSAF